MLSLLGSDGLSDYVQIVMSNIIGSFPFIFEFLSNSCMFSVAFYYFVQVMDHNSKRERCSCPPMTSLSDNNMSLGDVMLPPGENNGACTCGCKDCLLYAKLFLCSCLLLWVYILGGARNLILERCSG